MVVELVTNRTERVEKGAALRARGPGVSGGATQRAGESADGYELIVRDASPLPVALGKLVRYLVTFEGFDTRDHAEALRGTVLLGESIADPDVLWAHEIIGADVCDRSGAVLGRVASLVANPASDLMELESGALVPLRFVESLNSGRIVVDLPEGLL